MCFVLFYVLHLLYYVVYVCIVNCVYCSYYIFCAILYTVTVVQELFKFSIVCLILYILCASCIMCFYTVLYELCILPAASRIKYYVSKLCTVDVSPVLCLH